MGDPKTSPQPTEHVVKAGDRMSRIAYQYGYKDYNALHAAQPEAFRKKRPNPEILMPGDKVALPEKKEQAHPTPDKKQKKYEEDTKLPEVKVRLVVAGKPLASKSLVVRIEGPPYSLKQPFQGAVTTDDKGMAAFHVDPIVEEVLLVCDKPALSIKLKLGHLRPATEAGGVEQRLDNLGYRVPIAPPAAPAGSEAEKKAKEDHERRLQKAAARFQERSSKPVTGKIDDDLRQLLVKTHEP